MRKLFILFILTYCSTAIIFAQPKPKQTPTRKPAAEIKPKPAVDFGEIVDRTYTNFFFGFQLTFPTDWYVNTVENDADLKKAKINLDIDIPKNTKSILNAFKFQETKGINAVIRISVEDLEDFPAIKDAVDYIDAMRQTFQAKKLPADFKYSETNAEKLGYMQFAYLDISGNKGKKRLYATVRNGFAIIFTLTHNNDNDLTEMKRIITDADFSLQNIDFKAQ